ncbi:MAG: alpha/beta fold hydrolase [Planctomycetota bacterium]|nr:alpha/beta fold hydrolase [Planctomycetota bacterium]
MHTALLLLGLTLLSTLLAADVGKSPEPAEPAGPRSARGPLLTYRDAAGQTQPVKTPQDFARRREVILRGMQEAMGPLPDRAHLPPLDVRVIATFERPEYQRLTISFVSEIDRGKEDRVPAYLYLPRATTTAPSAPTAAPGANRRPAILALHQTHPLGKGDVDFEQGRTNRCFASELAARGYIVLAPDYPSFGDYAYEFDNPRYVSGTMKGIFNHMRAVDLLASREDVDIQRLGVIGHSLGGHNSLFVASFDPRIKAVVTSCGWTPFHDYYGGKIAGWTSNRYMPRLRDAYGLDPGRVPFDFDELIAALAPRPVFTNAPTGDDNFAVDGVKRATTSIREVYALWNAEKNLVTQHPASGHDFPPEVREAAYRFLDDSLRR